MRGRDREGGITSTAVVSNPMSENCFFKAPGFENLNTETSIMIGALLPPPSLSLPRMGGGNRVARTFATHAMCLRSISKRYFTREHTMRLARRQLMQLAGATV